MKAVGIDVSKNDFQTCLLEYADSTGYRVLGTRKFSNSEQGFENLLKWIKKHQTDGAKFIMEATGVYHENLAYYLFDKGQQVCIILANKMKSFFKSLNVKTKTDQVDARIIAQFGLERRPECWEPMSPQFKSLRAISRKILACKKDLTRAKNQLHAMDSSFGANPKLEKLKKSQIKFLTKMIDELRKELYQLVGKDADLKERIKKLTSIPGVRDETSIIVVSETNGFSLFQNIRQVVSFAGLDVSHNESGLFKGRSKISKKGNSKLRQVLYMSALTATRFNEPIKQLYQRICEKNPTVKRKGIVASMRKLLILMFVLWGKNEAYDKNYQRAN